MAGQTSQITQAGSVLGTAAYLAPEQATGGDVGPASDLYGLGVVTYQLLAGRLPYDAGSLTELAMLQQRHDPPRLDQLTSEVPAALAVAVERALALDPRDRYASADEMRAALHDGARGIAPVGAESTAATAMLSSRAPTAPTRAVPAASPRRLQPTPGPPVYEQEEPASYGARDDRRRRSASSSGRGGGLLVLLLIAAIVAGLIAFAIGSSQGGSTSVHISPVNGNTTDDIVNEMNRLIDDNTR
jgi:serine/threonine-protein kinase